MAIPQEKIYKPINGEEAIDLIMNEFYRELVNSGLFPLHRVWHEFEIQGGVRVKGWSTRTEEVKFEVKYEGPQIGEQVEGRVDVKIEPQPPDLLRETFEKFACPKCGRESRSRAGNVAHQRWCKAEAPRQPSVVDQFLVTGMAALGKPITQEEINAAFRGESNESTELDATAPADTASSSI